MPHTQETPMTTAPAPAPSGLLEIPGALPWRWSKPKPPAGLREFGFFRASPDGVVLAVRRVSSGAWIGTRSGKPVLSADGTPLWSVTASRCAATLDAMWPGGGGLPPPPPHPWEAPDDDWEDPWDAADDDEGLTDDYPVDDAPEPSQELSEAPWGDPEAAEPLRYDLRDALGRADAMDALEVADATGADLDEIRRLAVALVKTEPLPVIRGHLRPETWAAVQKGVKAEQKRW